MKRKLLVIFSAVLAAIMICSLAACTTSKEVTVELSKTSLTLTVGESETLTATTSDDSSVTWTSSDADVASVNSRGVVTAQGAGTAIITATSGEASASCTVTVNAKVETTISDLPETATVERGETLTLTATASDGSALIWSSGDESIATVKDGVVTGVFPGECTIIVQTASGARAECVLTVTYTKASSSWYALSFYEQNKIPDGTWGYWNDQAWTGSTVLMNSAEYNGDSEDSDAGSVTISYTVTSGSSWYGMQIAYRSKEQVQKDHYYTLKCTIEVDVACKITVNGSEVALKAGINSVAVDFLCDDDGHIYDEGDYTNPSSAVFILMGTSSDENMVPEATITISQLSWTEFTPVALSTPSISISDKVVTITDTENDKDKVGSYKVGFFAEGADSPTYIATLASGAEIDDSAYEDGTYIVKAKAIAKDASVSDSDWSEGVSYTVANGGVHYDIEGDGNYQTSLDGKWHYYSESNGVTTAKYEKGTVTFVFESTAGNEYSTQLFYENTANVTGASYTLTMNINANKGGDIKINGTSITLVEGDNPIELTYTEPGTVSINIVFGSTYVPDEGGNITIIITDIAFASNGAVTPEEPVVDNDPDGTTYQPSFENDLVIGYDGAEAAIGSDTWGVWYQGWDPVVSITANYTDNKDGITLTWSNGTGNYWSVQVFYKGSNLTIGTTYTLTCKINASVAGSVTINGEVIELVAGDNNVTVTFDNTSAIGSDAGIAAFDMQMGVDGGSPIGAATLTITDILWTKTSANDEGEGGEEGGNEGGEEGEVTFTNGAESDAVAKPDNWIYWNDQAWCGSTVTVTSPTIEDGVLSFEYTYGGTYDPGWGNNATGCWFGMQLFYKDSSLTAGNSYTLSLNLNSSVAGRITVNNTVVTITAGPNTITVTYTEAANAASVSIQFGVDEITDGAYYAIPGGTFTLSDVTIVPASESGNEGGEESETNVTLVFVQTYNDYYMYFSATSTVDLTTATAVYVKVNGTQRWSEVTLNGNNAYTFKVYVGDLTLSSYSFEWYNAAGEVIATAVYTPTAA